MLAHITGLFLAMGEPRCQAERCISVVWGNITGTSHTNLDGCIESCLSICMDEKVADLLLLARCRFGKCLGLYLLQQLVSLKNRIDVPCLDHRPSYYLIRAGSCCVKDNLKMG